MTIDPIQALLWYLAFVVSVTAHEAGHAYAAYRGGDPTAYLGGQVSLNPIPHMQREPFGMLILPLLSVFSNGWPIGWASTPYDPRWEARYPRRAAWMAAAGPAANLALAVFALVGLRAGLALGSFEAPAQIASFSDLVVASDPAYAGAGQLLSIMLVLNTILFLFNLIPFPPLDGASVLPLLLPADTAQRLKSTLLSGGATTWIGLIAAWMLFPRVFRPVWALLIELVHPGQFTTG